MIPSNTHYEFERNYSLIDLSFHFLLWRMKRTKESTYVDCGLESSCNLTPRWSGLRIETNVTLQ
jgi:hypothetical protein